MIIPYGHDRLVSRFPWLTLSIIAACTLVQIYASFFAPDQDDILRFVLMHRRADAATTIEQATDMLDKIPMFRFGYVTGEPFSYRIVTSAFVHGGWIHLIGNMLFLWLCGSALEDRLGRLKFALLYVAGAIFSTYAFELAHSGDPIRLVGASGAISAVMGAFLVYFSRTQIMLWYWLWVRTGTFNVPAYIALPAWLAEQFVTAAWTRATEGIDQVAYAAHIGGFLFGIVVAAIASLIWKGGGETSDDGEYRPQERAAAPPPDDDRDAQIDDRYRRCMDAIAQRDATTVRLLPSRVILDLARKHDHKRIVDLYKELARLPKIPLTDGGFDAAATAAESIGDLRAASEIRMTLAAEHPGSRFIRRRQ